MLGLKILRQLISLDNLFYVKMIYLLKIGYKLFIIKDYHVEFIQNKN
jgi:hypothetical protein